MVDRSPPVRLFRWLCSWRGIRRLLIVLAWTLTIVALLYGEENWRGRRVWTKYRHELEARGEQLDLEAFIPKPIPDEQNFAATPIVVSWFSQRTNSQHWADDYSRASAWVPSPKDNRHRQYIDLVGWQMAYEAIRSGDLTGNKSFESDKTDLESRAKAAPAVLEGLKVSETNLAELRSAARRPSVRYPVFYNLETPSPGILLPHLAHVKAACNHLELRACAALAAGQSENALEDVRLILYLADSFKDEPFLISYLVRIACLQLGVQPIWEGLAERRWSDVQLQELQKRLQFDFLGALKRSKDGERAIGILTADLLRQNRYSVGDLWYSYGYLSDEPTAMASLVGRMAPHGWYYQERFNFCRLYENQLRGAFDAVKKRIFPSQIAIRSHELEKALDWGHLGRTLDAVIHHHFLATLLLPQLETVPRKAAIAQATSDQAALACALERYRLANGQFPETLESLAPKYLSRLPNDPITGESYKYHRSDAGGFILYSVGWDERDDGGVRGKTRYDDKNGDWVWESRPPSAP